MAQMAADYTDLAVEHTDIWNSDYMPSRPRELRASASTKEGITRFITSRPIGLRKSTMHSAKGREDGAGDNSYRGQLTHTCATAS